MEKLKQNIQKNIPPKFRNIVNSAILFSEECLKGKTRYNKEHMTMHTLNLALLTTELEMDVNSTIAALLHEIELTEEKASQIGNLFSDDVVSLLENMLDIKKHTLLEENDPEIIVKYILNSSKDLRPVFLKILDALEDVKTVKYVPQEKRKDTLTKAVDIYSVLAEYLNLDRIKKEMDEYAFKELLPIEYENISQKMETAKINDELLEKYREIIWTNISNLPFQKELHGRIKSKFSIYKKLKKKEKERTNPSVSDIEDLVAFRIITDSDESCFSIVEKLIDIGEVNYEGLDDYISNPKPNGYQAIQFPIRIPSVSDLEIEVQVLTTAMHYKNTYGTASHIAYKASKSRFAKASNKFNWVEEIHHRIKLQKQKRLDIENLPVECRIFEEEVLALTPKGKIISLNKEDTILDFAFKLHTQIGNTAVSATLNGKPAKLATQLKTGDIVEIRTDKSKRYQKVESLKFVNSPTSKFRIRSQLSKFKKIE